MTAPCTSICTPWATIDDVCAPCTEVYDLDQALLDDMLDVASDVLYILSGSRFPGSCQETVRPCGGDCGCGRSRCGCSTLSEVDLGYYPITSILEVKVDGDILVNGTDYRVDEFSKLVRLGDEAWPRYQDLSLGSDQDNTFEVTFTYGVPPPPAGVKAAAELACQLTLACTPGAEGKCKLPKRTRSVARQGVTIEMFDPNAFLDKGKIGLYVVDLFLTTYPRPSPLAMASPDIGPSVRRVGT